MCHFRPKKLNSLRISLVLLGGLKEKPGHRQAKLRQDEVALNETSPHWKFCNHKGRAPTRTLPCLFLAVSRGGSNEFGLTKKNNQSN